MDSNRDQIEEIKARLDIVDVVGKYVQLKQAGKNFSGLCPFHTEKTPSFIVSPDIQRYKCFGCGQSGDIFNFVQNIEHIDFPETLEKLAKEAGVVLVKRNVNTKYDRLQEINRKAAIYFYKNLLNPVNKIALQYVKDRGISDESIKIFGIGYSSDSTSLLNFIQKDIKYSKDELIASGLFVLKEGRIKSKFYKRIMFPIRSSSGRVVAFTARIMPGNDFGPKYMNSPETDIYHKKENLYGQYESRQEIRKNDLAIICEGTTDVIAAHQAGIKNIVAPLGTSLTKEQLEKISKLSRNILFLFDSDSAGQQALQRAFLIAQQLDLTTFAANTLPYKDIDEMVVKDSNAFVELINKRIDTFTYLLIEQIKDKDLSKLQNYQRIVSWIEKVLQNVRSETEYKFYVEKARQIGRFEITPKGLNKGYSTQRISTVVQKSIESSRERIYLSILLYQEEIKIPKNHELKFFKSNENIYKILQYIQNEKSTSRINILQHFSDGILKQVIEDAIFSFSDKENTMEDLDDIYVNIVREYFSKKEREYNINIAIAEEREDQAESERLLAEYQNLTKEKQKYEQHSKL